MHHTLEDQAMYPRLRAADPALGPALDRMLEEHLDVHGRLEELDRALVALVADDTGAGLDGVRTALVALEETLLAHLDLRGGPARRAAQPARLRALARVSPAPASPRCPAS